MLKVVVFDLASWTIDQVLEGHIGMAWNAAFAPGNDDLLVSSAADGGVKLWSLSLGRNVATLEASAGDVFTVAVGPKGQRLAAAGEELLLSVTSSSPNRIAMSSPVVKPVLPAEA
jgi:WD40 repeat protein